MIEGCWLVEVFVLLFVYPVLPLFLIPSLVHIILV